MRLARQGDTPLLGETIQYGATTQQDLKPVHHLHPQQQQQQPSEPPASLELQVGASREEFGSSRLGIPQSHTVALPAAQPLQAQFASLFQQLRQRRARISQEKSAGISRSDEGEILAQDGNSSAAATPKVIAAIDGASAAPSTKPAAKSEAQQHDEQLSCRAPTRPKHSSARRAALGPLLSLLRGNDELE